MIWGSSAWVADATTRASGTTPSRSAAAARQDDGTGTVTQGRGVARRHLCRVRLRREGGQRLEGGVATDALVVLEAPAGVRRVAGISTGSISRASRPESRAAAARW